MNKPLPNDSDLRAAARSYIDQLELHPENLSLARNRILQASRSLDRATRVHALLALLCGENTARTAIQASLRRHKVQLNHDLPVPLLRDLSRIATELCGKPAGQLIWEMGQ